MTQASSGHHDEHYSKPYPRMHTHKPSLALTIRSEEPGMRIIYINLFLFETISVVLPRACSSDKALRGRPPATKLPAFTSDA